MKTKIPTKISSYTYIPILKHRKIITYSGKFYALIELFLARLGKPVLEKFKYSKQYNGNEPSM